MGGRREANGAARAAACALAAALGLLRPDAAGAQVSPNPYDLARDPMRVYTDRDGLPENSLFDFEVDRRGYLWVATENGPAYYDGRRWRAFELPPDVGVRFVRAVLPASDGSLWFAMDQAGLLRHRDGQWTRFSPADGFPAEVRDLVEQPGRTADPVVWAGTREGVVRVQGDQWRVVAPDGDRHFGLVSRLLWARDGRTLYAGYARSVARIVDGRFDRGFDALPDAPGNQIGALTEVVADDGSTSLWVGMTRDGIRVFEHGAWRVQPSPSPRIFALRASPGPRGGTVWAGSYGDGLMRWRDGRWAVFDGAWGLASDIVRDVHETVTPEGRRTLWIGTQGGGLIAMHQFGWRSFDRRSGLPTNFASSIRETRDPDGGHSIWIGTNRGIAQLRESGITVHDAARGLPVAEVTSMAVQRRADGVEALWAVIGNQVVCHVDGQWKVWRPGELLGRIPFGLGVDAEQNIYVTGAPTPLRFARGVDVATTLDDVPGMAPRGSAWFVSGQGPGVAPVLWSLNFDGFMRYEQGQWINPGASPPSPIVNLSTVLATLEPDGKRRLWVGGRGAGGPFTLQMDEPGARWRDLRERVAGPLPESLVQMNLDRTGALYLFSTRGIVRLTPRRPRADDPFEFDAVTFTVNDGLPSDRVQYDGSLVDHRGRVWAATLGGVAYFDPEEYVADRTAKPLYVDRAVAGDGRVLQPGDRLAPEQNSVRFELALVSHFREDDTRFRTQLVGFDARPTAWSNEAHREITNLAAGDYELRAWGRDWAGNVSGPVSLSFHVSAPWWNWWGAWLLYAVAALALVYLLVRHRTHALRRETEVLESRVAERTAELKASEERALQASQAKGSFLANMSHELRTPLNAILGFAQLMAREPGRSERDRQRLATLNRSGEHLLGLINDVLSLARIESGAVVLHSSPFDLRSTLQQVEEMFRLRADEKGLKLDFEIAAELPAYVRGDEGKLRQVLINLVGNAVKFTERGAVRVRVRREAARTCIEVVDTGPGISEADRELVFRAFGQATTRRADEGSGLGLSICAGFVAAMGGRIGIESRAGEGSCFRVELDLPECDDGGTSVGHRRVVGISGPARPRILVADDVAENRELLAELLGSVGLEVRSSEDGREALDEWAAWQPELVFLDVVMPRLDGIALTREIRRREGERASGRLSTVLVAVSASAFDHDRDAVLAAGADDFIAKPIVERELWDVLARHLGLAFVYEDEGDPDATPLDAAALGALPADWRDALRAALRRGDVLGAGELLARIEAQQPALARTLRMRLDAFEIDALLEVLEAG